MRHHCLIIRFTMRSRTPDEGRADVDDVLDAGTLCLVQESGGTAVDDRLAAHGITSHVGGGVDQDVHARARSAQCLRPGQVGADVAHRGVLACDVPGRESRARLGRRCARPAP